MGGLVGSPGTRSSVGSYRSMQPRPRSNRSLDLGGSHRTVRHNASVAAQLVHRKVLEYRTVLEYGIVPPFLPVIPH